MRVLRGHTVLHPLSRPRGLMLIGLGLYAGSFLLTCVDELFGPHFTGFGCARETLTTTWTQSAWPSADAPRVQFVSTLLSGWINPVFLLTTGVWQIWPRSGLARGLRLLWVCLLPACWVVFFERQLHPTEAYYVWTAGMFLALFPEKLVRVSEQRPIGRRGERIYLVLGLVLYFGSFFLTFAGPFADFTGARVAEMLLPTPREGGFKKNGLEYLGLLAFGWVNPVFVLTALLMWFQQPNARPARLLRALVLLLFFMTGILWFAWGLHPAEGGVAWISGMLLVLFSGSLAHRHPRVSGALPPAQTECEGTQMG